MRLENNKYYIVNITTITKPFMYKNAFNSKPRAMDVLEKYIKTDYVNYKIVTGEEAIKYNLKFGKHKKIIITKYVYPPDTIKGERQPRKTFRTQARRRKRRAKRLENNT